MHTWGHARREASGCRAVAILHRSCLSVRKAAWQMVRAHVLPQMETDALVLPDTMVAGPDLAPPTEEHRAKLFG